jgi:hypothetical protein
MACVFGAQGYAIRGDAAHITGMQRGPVDCSGRAQLVISERPPDAKQTNGQVGAYGPYDTRLRRALIALLCGRQLQRPRCRR